MGLAFRIVDNRQKVIKQLSDLEAGLQTLGVTMHPWAAQAVAAKAYQLAHVGPDPTYPKGRPHTRETIRVQPLNQYGSRVLADGGAPWEERRGGDHAFMTRAVEVVEPEALAHFTQEGLKVVRRVE